MAERVARWCMVEPVFTPESVATVRQGPQVSSAKAERELGFRARPLTETINDTLNWFAQIGMLGRDARR